MSILIHEQSCQYEFRKNSNKTIFYLAVMCWCLFWTSTKADGASLKQVNEQIEALDPLDKKLFYKVADQLRCPTCTGLSILQSDALFSLQLKKALLERLSREKDLTKLIEFFTQRYGLWILREPPKSGFHLWLAWWIPIGMIGLGFVLLGRLVWRRKRSQVSYGLRTTSEILEELSENLKAEKLKKQTVKKESLKQQ